MGGSHASSARLLSIHYLRAVAALMIVVYHVYSHCLVSIDHPVTVIWLKNGIGLFFAISGFVMVSSTSGQDCGPAKFLLRRLRRIVPLYWLATLLMALLHQEANGWRFLSSLLFVPTSDTLQGRISPPVLDVGWTLNFEMAFYGLFALAMLLPRRLAIGTLALLLTSLAFLGGTLRAVPMLDYYCQPCLLDFAVGLLIAQLRVQAPIWCLPLGFALLALTPQFVETPIVSVTLPVALILASALSVERFLRETPAMMLLGDASYAIYLFHLFVVFPMFNLGGASWNPALTMTVTFLGSIILGLIVHLGIERPLGRVLGRKSGQGFGTLAWRAHRNRPAA